MAHSIVLPHSPSPIQPSMHLSPFVRIPFTVKVTTISDTAMLGSGCSICIVPISQLPKEARKHMTYSDIHMKGINSNTNYELDCDIAIGNHDSPIFKRFSQIILSQGTLNSISNQNTIIKFRCRLIAGCTTHTAMIILASKYETSTYDPAYEYKTSTSNEKRPSLRCQTIIQTLS